MRPDRHERGAALLTVLLLVAVVAVIAGVALERLRLATRLAGNALAGEQARAYAYAAETLATTRVTALLGQDASKVTLAGGWYGRPFGLPLPGGLATARVTDGGNCFNLNGLVRQLSPGVYTTNDGQRVIFARLMRLAGVPAQLAESVAAGAADWIDSDQDQQSLGAEDATYLARATPYRTGATLMADPSELRAVAGVTPDTYIRIRPWICTLPRAEPAKVNVNTLTPEQAPLVAMLAPETLSVPAARQLILKRPPQGFASTSAFWAGTDIVGATDQTAVTTIWFALAIDVALGPAQLQESALIDASRLPARLVRRQWGEPT